jgi:hypothetical protein
MAFIIESMVKFHRWIHILGFIFTELMFFKGSKPKKQSKRDQNGRKDRLVCKFVFDGLGHMLGESISIDHDLIIIKTDDCFLGIPLKHVESDGKKVIVKGLVDTKNAKVLGERWRKEELNKGGVVYDK